MQGSQVGRERHGGVLEAFPWQQRASTPAPCRGLVSVIERMAHAHLGHDGPFGTCPRCQSHHLIWTPSTDFGILIHATNGRLVESSLAATLLLVP